MVKNLVLSGGSMKGLAYIGMIKCIEEYDIVKKIDNFVGTSIGACVCFCLMIGFTYEMYRNTGTILKPLEIVWNPS